MRTCPLDQVRRDAVQVVELAKEDGRPREALVLRDDSGEVRVYLNRCEHISIPIDGGSREFFSPDGTHLMCGTHGAMFRLHDGFCVAGPCSGRSLLALPFRIVDGRVEILLEH